MTVTNINSTYISTHVINMNATCTTKKTLCHNELVYCLSKLMNVSSKSILFNSYVNVLELFFFVILTRYRLFILKIPLNIIKMKRCAITIDVVDNKTKYNNNKHNVTTTNTTKQNQHVTFGVCDNN